MSSGRLPSLRDSAAPKTGLKFKPKVVARRSKEERDASAPKVRVEEKETPKFDKKKNNFRGPGGAQKRIPRYLLNTRVVSSGPLAAGNFSGSVTDDLKRGFVKMEGDNLTLVQKGLESIENDAADSDEDLKESKSQSRFNMGREYTPETYKAIEIESEDEAERDAEGDVEMGEEVIQRQRIEQLFPIRPLRIRYEDTDGIKKEAQDLSTSETPQEQNSVVPSVKPEPDAEHEAKINTLNDVLRQKEVELENKLSSMNIESETTNVDRMEATRLADDYKHIITKLDKINNKPNSFILFHLPYILPSFKEVEPKDDPTEGTPAGAELNNNNNNDSDNNNPDAQAEDTHSIVKDEPLEESVGGPTDDRDVAVKQENEDDVGKGNTESKKSEEPEAEQVPEKKFKPKKQKANGQGTIPQDQLYGRIGTLRYHKSGKITAKIGNAILNVSRGLDTSFLQDVVALNEDEESPAVELLGKLAGKIVITPNFEDVMDQ